MDFIEYDDIIIKKCICCWYDLLGYGRPFIEAKWDLNNPACRENVKRIEMLKGWFWGLLSFSSKATKMCFNDGAISSVDVDINVENSIIEALYFLDTIIYDYLAVNDIDKGSGFPGVRGVITCGDRFEYDNVNTVFDHVEHRTVAFHPKEFQMNTAFSKAFIMEESGSKAGLKGANLFIDKDLFSLLQNKYTDCHKAMDNELIQKQKGEDIITITYKNEWFADIIIDDKEIEYNNMGIETVLYRMIGIETRLNEIAKENARKEGARYAMMMEYEESFL